MCERESWREKEGAEWESERDEHIIIEKQKKKQDPERNRQVGREGGREADNQIE